MAQDHGISDQNCSPWDFHPCAFPLSRRKRKCEMPGGASYSPAANASAMKWLESRPLPDRIIHLLSRLAFRGIYFPQMKRRDWARVLLRNRSSILKVILQALEMKRRSMMKQTSSPQDSSTGRNNTHVDPARRSWRAGE